MLPFDCSRSTMPTVSVVAATENLTRPLPSALVAVPMSSKELPVDELITPSFEAIDSAAAEGAQGTPLDAVPHVSDVLARTNESCTRVPDVTVMTCEAVPVFPCV